MITSPNPMAHAVPLPGTLQGRVTVHEDNTLKIMIITFVVGLMVGSAVLLTVVSLWRIHLKNQKQAEIAGASLGNPRAACNKGDTLYKAKRCTFVVMSYDETGTFHAHGSGISLGNGLVVTNRHVTQGGTTYKTRVDGKEAPLELIQSSTERDISLLRSNQTLPQCPIFDDAQLAQGEELYAIGWPKEKDQIDPAITRGIFSRFNTQNDGQSYIQTDAAINPGNSGGSLVNECGIVGMNTAKFSWFDSKTPIEGLSLALPMDQVIKIVKELEQK